MQIGLEMGSFSKLKKHFKFIDLIEISLHIIFADFSYVCVCNIYSENKDFNARGDKNWDLAIHSQVLNRYNDTTENTVIDYINWFLSPMILIKETWCMYVSSVFVDFMASKHC